MKYQKNWSDLKQESWRYHQSLKEYKTTKEDRILAAAVLTIYLLHAWLVNPIY